MNAPGACPGPEELAAFIDGNAPGPRRGTLFVHLDACPACRELAAESAAVSEALPGAVPARRRVLAAAAAAVFIATAGLAWLLLARGAPPATGFDASLAVAVRHAGGSAEGLPGPVSRGAYAFAPTSLPEQAAFRAGKDLIRLGAAAAREDRAAVAATGRRLAGIVEGLLPEDRGILSRLRDLSDETARGGLPPGALEIPGLVAEALADAGHGDAVDLGAWTVAAWIAAGAGDTAFISKGAAAASERIPPWGFPEGFARSLAEVRRLAQEPARTETLQRLQEILADMMEMI